MVVSLLPQLVQFFINIGHFISSESSAQALSNGIPHEAYEALFGVQFTANNRSLL